MKLLQFCFILFVINIPLRSELITQLSEKEKIVFLITTIKNEKECQFIRNGNTYSPVDAAIHLEMKWKKHEDKVLTVNDFIEIVGTKSNITQQPYLVKFSDGKTQELAVYLRLKLRSQFGM
jgi:hypothetical protein